MPTRTLAELSQTAIARGLDPSTPAVAVVRATRPDETVIAASIRDLPARLAELPAGPVLVMIGQVFADIEAVPELRAPAMSGSSRRNSAVISS